MTFRIEVQLDIPTLLADPKSLEARLVKVIDEELRIIRRLFDRFTATWSVGKRPKWRADIRRINRDLQGRIYTDSRIMVWVGLGTDKRFAIMGEKASDYKPKTRPGSIQSRHGGYVGPNPQAFPVVRRRNRSARAKRGITARNPHFEVVRIREKFFGKKISTQVTRWSNALPGSRRKVRYVI